MDVVEVEVAELVDVVLVVDVARYDRVEVVRDVVVESEVVGVVVVVAYVVVTVGLVVVVVCCCTTRVTVMVVGFFWEGSHTDEQFWLRASIVTG